MTLMSSSWLMIRPLSLLDDGWMLVKPLYQQDHAGDLLHEQHSYGGHQPNQYQTSNTLFFPAGLLSTVYKMINVGFNLSK